MTRLRYDLRSDWLFYLLVLSYTFLIVNMTAQLWFGGGINIFASYSDAATLDAVVLDANKIYWSKTCFLFGALLLIAYIVDISGSMREGRKLEVAMRELSRSISALPDYAQFHVLLFSTSYVEPPMQTGWMRARRSTVTAITTWLERVTPGGGTLPMEAFVHAFSLSTRPDVIFFLTDGEIPAKTAAEVAQLNDRGQRVVINTIAFGDPTSQEQLKQIATDSGGAYRFVPSR